MKPFVYLLLLTCLISCTGKTDSTTDVSNESFKSPLSADAVPTDTSEILAFDERIAISVYPDTTYMNEQQKSMDEEAWATIVDDQMYYESMAIDTLKSIGVEMYSQEIPAGKRFYKFKLSGGDYFFLDTRKVSDSWGVILYNGKDIPSVYSCIEVGNVMDSIFRK